MIVGTVIMSQTFPDRVRSKPADELEVYHPRLSQILKYCCRLPNPVPGFSTAPGPQFRADMF